MGKSKSWKAGPGWQGPNTPGAKEQANKAGAGPAIVNAEGTHMSGEDEYGRMGHGGRNKSKSRKVSAKTKGIYGQS